MEDYHEKYKEIIAVVAEIRATILENYPEYEEKYLPEMVACPQACIERIQQWVSEQVLKSN